MTVFEIVTVKADVSAEIERIADREAVDDCLADFIGGFPSHEGTAGIVDDDSLDHPVDRSFEENYGSGLEHKVDVVEETRGATTACDDGIFELSGLLEHGLFHLAEACFALVGENSGDRFAETLLDVEVEVDEITTSSFCEGPAESGFSGGHISDDENRGAELSHKLRAIVQITIARQTAIITGSELTIL